MNHRIVILFVLGLLLYGKLSAQDFKEQFVKATENQDTTMEFSVLKRWEVNSPKDAELYLAYFSHYTSKSRKEVINLGTTRGNASHSALSTDVVYNEMGLTKGLDYIDKGISVYPDRLDMHLAKVKVLGEGKKYVAMTQEIVNLIEFSHTIKGQWKGEDGSLLQDSESKMLAAVQKHIQLLFDTHEDYLLENVQKIAETVLKYYPNNLEIMASLATSYTFKNDYDKALEILLNGEKINPKDINTLNTIAALYHFKKDKAQNIRYYKLVVKYGNEEERLLAKEMISDLEKAKK